MTTNKTKQFIEKAIKKHGNKYGYSKVKFEHCKKNVTIICYTHGDFEQAPYNHLRSYGCKECQNDIRIAYQQKKFIEKAIEIHGNKYGYSKVKYLNCEKNVTIICYIHGDFEQQPNNHLCGKGCKQCGRERTGNAKKKDIHHFIKRSIQVHGDKYIYSESIYNGSGTNLTIICKIHGRFQQTPDNHYQGAGCKKCGNIIIANKARKDTEYFIKKSRQIHGDKYDYSLSIYKGKDIPLIIICKIHGEFKQRPNNHYHGNGCSSCNCNYSKKSIQWLKFVSLYNNIDIQHVMNKGEYRVPTVSLVDGFCAVNNTVYEFHGDFWHGNPMIYNILNTSSINPKTGEFFCDLYNKTIIKQNKIKKLGYNLVIMWENEWDTLNYFIKKIQTKWKKYKEI